MAHVTVYLNGPIDAEQLGFDPTSLILGGASIFTSLFGGLFAPCKGQNVACGLEGITAAVNQVTQALNQAKAMLQGGSVPAQQIPQLVAEAEAAANALSDPSKVWQAKKGKDAAALAAGKQQAAQLVAEIKTLAAQAAANAPTGTDSLLSGTVAGIPTIAIVGAAAVGVVVLMMNR